MSENCSGCRFWERGQLHDGTYGHPPYWSDLDSGGHYKSTFGRCRLKPPLESTYAIPEQPWPVTRQGDWCGSYQVMKGETDATE